MTPIVIDKVDCWVITGDRVRWRSIYTSSSKAGQISICNRTLLRVIFLVRSYREEKEDSCQSREEMNIHLEIISGKIKKREKNMLRYGLVQTL